jgi:uncharacterized membrane protein YhaH (DUF805 family)
MEKSIETIWKEGFLDSGALVAPKLNDLYNQKSIDIVDKFRRMYKINIIAIIVFAFTLLPLVTLTDLPYMGIPMFLLFITMVFFSTKFYKRLNDISKNSNSYQYLKTFDNWTKEMVSFNTRLSRYMYPYIFLSMVAGFWFGSFGGNVPGNDFVNAILADYPDITMLFGIPLIGIIILLLSVALLAFFGSRIGQWDLNLVYGRILRRLNTLVADMEELRA